MKTQLPGSRLRNGQGDAASAWRTTTAPRAAAPGGHGRSPTDRRAPGPLGRNGTRALGLGAAAAMALAVWAWSGADPAPPPAAPAGEAFPWGRTPVVEADTPTPAAATAGSAPVATADPLGSSVMEVCGLGRVPLPAGAPEEGSAGGLEALPTPVGSASLDQARTRLLTGLHQGANARARVAALLLQRPDTEDPMAWHAWAQATLHQALAQPDAVALSWAEEACGRLAGDGSQGSACRLQLIRARLKLEPDNAQHWAALADEDPGAADEAWQGLLRARRWHETPQALVLVTQQALPADVPGYLRLALGAEVGTRAAALPSPGEGFLQDRCSEPVPGRQAECQALAQMLVAHSDATQTLALGLKVGQAAGWSPDRVQAVQQELQALASDRVRWQPEAAQPLSCRGVESWQQHLQQVAALGELPALRLRLAELQGPR